MHGGWVHDRLREEHNFYGHGCSKAKRKYNGKLFTSWMIPLSSIKDWKQAQYSYFNLLKGFIALTVGIDTNTSAC